jgi:hypothetical protein
MGVKLNIVRSRNSGPFETAVLDFKVKLIEDMIDQLPQDQQDRVEKWFPSIKEDGLQNLYYLIDRSIVKVKQRQAEANSITQV